MEDEQVAEEIKRRRAKRIILQLPEGLKSEGCRLVTMVENAGAVAIVSADTCYGACDVITQEADILGADLVIHYGHTRMLKEESVPTIYIEAKAKVDINSLALEAVNHLEHWNFVGLVTTVQHVDMLNEIRRLLLSTGKTVAIGNAGRLKYAGQVTGCDCSNARSIMKDVEVFLFVGGGKFHAIGVALSTSKPAIVADPYEKRVYSVEADVKKVLKQRWASICEAHEAQKFGVLIGLKSGQTRVKEAINIKKEFEQSGRKAILLAVREVTSEVLMQFPEIEAFVNTACPRLSFDDASNFSKPVLTINESLVMIGKMAWGELCTKGWFGS